MGWRSFAGEGDNLVHRGLGGTTQREQQTYSSHSVTLNVLWEAVKHNLNPLHMPPWKQSLICRVHGLSYYGKPTLF